MGTNAPNHIRVWSWRNAPDELKALSPHGGDEDWVGLIPPCYAGEYIPWMEDGSRFGVCDVSVHEHPELPGFEVRIGAHA